MSDCRQEAIKAFSRLIEHIADIFGVRYVMDHDGLITATSVHVPMVSATGRTLKEARYNFVLAALKPEREEEQP